MSSRGKGLDGLSQTRLRAWSVFVIWALAGAGFFLAFFSGGGPRDFHADSGRNLLAAAAIGFGFLGWWTSLWLTRKRGGAVVADERDLQIVARAGQATLVIVCMITFAMAIGLWTLYEDAGVVPVGWLWGIAYAVVIVAVVTNSLTVLILDRGTSGHG